MQFSPRNALKIQIRIVAKRLIPGKIPLNSQHSSKFQNIPQNSITHESTSTKISIACRLLSLILAYPFRGRPLPANHRLQESFSSPRKMTIRPPPNLEQIKEGKRNRMIFDYN